MKLNRPAEHGITGHRPVQPGSDEPMPEPVPGQDDPNPMPAEPHRPPMEEEPGVPQSLALSVFSDDR